MIFKRNLNNRGFSVFFAVFRLRGGRGIFKNPRIWRIYTHKRRFGGVCRGENWSKVRGFGFLVRGFSFLCALAFFAFYFPIYIYFFKNQKERKKEEGKIQKQGCAVLKIIFAQVRGFFRACAVFRAPFRALKHY